MRSESTIGKLTRWVNRAPPGASSAEVRAFGLARVGFPLGLFAHASFIPLFWYLDQPVMAVFNIASVVWKGLDAELRRRKAEVQSAGQVILRRPQQSLYSARGDPRTQAPCRGKEYCQVVRFHQADDVTSSESRGKRFTEQRNARPRARHLIAATPPRAGDDHMEHGKLVTAALRPSDLRDHSGPEGLSA